MTHAYGFANGNFMDEHPEELDILKAWLIAGYSLGNHTYDHPNLNHVTTGAYIANIAREDHLLATLENVSVTDRRVFRYPYLDEGNTLAKRDAIRAYLSKNRYRTAEVTTDYYDWAWTDAYTRCIAKHDDRSISWLEDHVAESADLHLHEADDLAQLLFKRRIPQILLIHVGAFDVISLDAILKKWASEGVRFVSLDHALSDSVYRINPNCAYDDGRNFLEQVAQAWHVDTSRFEDPTYSIERLNQVCRAKPDRR